MPEQPQSITAPRVKVLKPRSSDGSFVWTCLDCGHTSPRVPGGCSSKAEALAHKRAAAHKCRPAARLLWAEWKAITNLALLPHEIKALQSYLRGKRLCRDYDRLTCTVQAAVNEITAKGL
jgi:hypothetical protein